MHKLHANRGKSCDSSNGLAEPSKKLETCIYCRLEDAAMEVKTKVKKSPIHGRGLFAENVIPKGMRIGEYQGPPAKRNSPYVLWFEDEEGEIRGIVGRNEIRFVNHSTQPNAEFVGPELVAIRAIAAGAEITAHYGDEWVDATS